MNSKNYDLNKALKQLQLRTNNNPQDRQQLTHILFEILGYPSIQLAEKHHRANNLGCNDLFSRRKQINQDIKNKNIQDLEVCQCCGLLVRNQQLPYCISFDELNIGVGVHLFFRNYLFTFGVFTLMFFLYSIYAIATNAEFNDVLFDGVMCIMPGNSCGVTRIGAGSKILSPDQQKNRLSRIQSWIGLGFIVIWGILNIVKTHLERKMIIDMDIRRVSAPDFSLMLTHFPKIYLNQSYQENLKNLNTIFKTYEKNVDSKFSYEIVKYNVARPLYSESIHVKQKMEELQQRLMEKQQIFRQWLKYRQEYLQFPVPAHERNKVYDEYIDFFSSEYDSISMKQVPLDQTNLVFVTLRDSKAMQEITSKNKPPSWKNFWNCCSDNDFPIRGVNVRKAPEPQQIKWQNVGFSHKSKIIRKILIWLVTLALIGISLAISIGIAYVDQQSISIGISVGISVVVTVINVGIQLAIMNLSYLQNQHISSTQQSNIALKIGVGQLINSIGVPIIVTILANNDPSIADKTWLKQGGLVHDVFYIALFNIAVPLARFLDPYEIILSIQRWGYEHPSQRLKMYGQKQLNKHYGNYEFDIGYQYAYLIKTSIFTAFFACMQPIIVLFAPFGLIMYYFADKRNLLRHFKRPSYHYATINKTVDFILLFSPIAFGFGHLLVNNFISQVQQGNGTLLINWIMVAVALGFLLIVPFQLFYKCISKPEYPRWDYYQMKPLIATDYDRSNPVDKDQAIAEFQAYLQELESKQELPDRARFIKMRVSNLRGTMNNNQRDRTDLMKSSMRMSNLRQSNPLMISGSMQMKSKPNYNTDLNQYNKYIHERQLFENSNQNMRNNRLPTIERNQFHNNLQSSYKYPPIDEYRSPRRQQ